MTQDLSESDKDFIKNVRKHLDDKGIEFVNNILKPILLAKDLPIMDIYYIIARVKQIMEQKYKEVNWVDPTILKLREAIFKSAVQEMKARKIKKPEKEERAERCEPVCRRVVDEILNVDFLMSDPGYFPKAVENDEELLAKVIITGYIDRIDNWLEMLLRENKRRADKVKWNDKEPEDITWKDMDKVLTK